MELRRFKEADAVSVSELIRKTSRGCKLLYESITSNLSG